ncbi:hypothetical protein B0H17DRAFT_1105959, partial [Mycena rosella]
MPASRRTPPNSIAVRYVHDVPRFSLTPIISVSRVLGIGNGNGVPVDFGLGGYAGDALSTRLRHMYTHCSL